MMICFAYILGNADQDQDNEHIHHLTLFLCAVRKLNIYFQQVSSIKHSIINHSHQGVY